MIDSVIWLSKRIKKERIWIIVIAALQTFSSLFGIVYAVLFRNLLDSATTGSVTSIRKYTELFISLLLLQCGINAALRLLKERITVEIENRMRDCILNNILYRDYSYVSEIHSGEWMNKMNNDAIIIARNAVNIVPNTVSIIAHIIVAVFVLANLVPDFMIFMFCLIIVALFFEFFFYRHIKVLHKEVQQKDDIVRIFIQECLDGLMVIKSYVKESLANRSFHLLLEEYKKTRLKKNRFSVVMSFFFGLGMNGILIFSGIYCAYAVINKQVSYGTFLAVIQIITQIRIPVTNAYSNIPLFYSMVGSIERLKEAEEFALEQSLNQEKQVDFERIELENVSFSYQDRNKEDHVIENLNLSIKKGDFVCITGPSGCGKSTLFKLLLGLYEPLKGKIKIKNSSSESILDSGYRYLFAYVPQNNQLIRGSIKEIICFGEPYNEDRMNRVLKISCCDFVFQMPMKLDSELKENGNGLSEGQMQRIAIARALYSDRPILLLDEVTSSLNEELEIEILNNLREMADKTVLLITHRKKAMEYVDTVVKCEEKAGEYRWSIS